MDKINHNNKSEWCREGVTREELFVNEVAPLFSLSAKINPEKQLGDKFAPDLIVQGHISDLKCQNTPFFTASRYGKSPSNTIGLNRKDVERYSNLYPWIHLYFWVKWERQENYGVEVRPVNGVWFSTLFDIKELIVNHKAPLHVYEKRADDTSGNAKDSYLISLSDLKPIGLIEVEP